MQLSCAVRTGEPPLPPSVPVLADRVGIDVEPLDLADPATLAWLAACIPPEAGAVTRFAAASALARAEPARTVRGSLLDALPAVVAELPPDALVCLVDTYVHVFLPPADLAGSTSCCSGWAATWTGCRSTRSCRSGPTPGTPCSASTSPSPGWRRTGRAACSA